MEGERMPKVQPNKDALRLTVSDLHHMKHIEEANLKRVIRLKKTRLLNRISGSILGATAIGIYAYTIYAVKQEKFLDDFDEPLKIADEQ